MEASQRRKGAKPGDREFATLLARADHIGAIEGWTGWHVFAHRRQLVLCQVGPFHSLRQARGWIRSWLPMQARPLTCIDPGSWHWHAVVWGRKGAS